MNDDLGSTEYVSDDDIDSVDIENEAVEQEEIEAEAETETDDAEETETEEGEESEEGSSEADLVEVEIDGETYMVPPSVRDASMRTSDYTEKTTALADARREHEANIEQFQRVREIKEASFEAHLQLSSIDQQLAQFNNVNWDQLISQDPNHAQALQIQRTELINQRNQAQSTIANAEQAFSKEQEQSLASHREKVAEQCASKIPDWSPEKATEIRDFALSAGIPQERLDNVSFEEVEILNLALDGQKYRQLKSKPQKPKPTPAKPVTKIRAKNQKVKKDLNDESPDAYRQRREREMGLRS